MIQQIQRAATVEIRADVEAYGWKHIAYHPGLRGVLPAVKMFCSAVLDNTTPRRWLSLLGPSGVGKTHLLKQAVRLLETKWRIKTKTGFRGPNVAHLIPAADLTDWKAAQVYAAYDLIYIEDIGAGQSMDGGSGKVTASRIRELLQLRSNKWTLLDANLYRADIAAALDGRIASRLKRDGSWMIEIPDEVPDFWDVSETKQP